MPTATLTDCPPVTTPEHLLTGTIQDFAWHRHSWSLAHYRLCDGSNDYHPTYFYIRKFGGPWQEININALIQGMPQPPIVFTTKDLAHWLESASTITLTPLQDIINALSTHGQIQ